MMKGGGRVGTIGMCTQVFRLDVMHAMWCACMHACVHMTCCGAWYVPTTHGVNYPLARNLPPVCEILTGGGKHQVIT